MSQPLVFHKAERRAVKLRIGFAGASGSGKTEGALAIAQAIVEKESGRIAVADSENGSASLYSDRYDFDTITLTQFDPEHYRALIKAAVDAKYTVLVLDSITHAWQFVLDAKEEHERRDPKANRWTLWGIYGPRWDKLMNDVLQAPIHILATMRSKQEYTQVEQGGAKKVVKMGMAPQVREGADYQFSLVFELNANHFAQATKNRTTLFGDELVDLRSPDVHRDLITWMNSGGPMLAPLAPATPAAAEAAVTTAAKPEHGSIEWANAMVLVGRHGKPHSNASRHVGRPIGEVPTEFLERASATFQADEKEKASEIWRVDQIDAIGRVLADRRGRAQPALMPLERASALNGGEDMRDPTPAPGSATEPANAASVSAEPAPAPAAEPAQAPKPAHAGAVRVFDQLILDPLMPINSVPVFQRMGPTDTAIELMTVLLKVAARIETPRLDPAVKTLALDALDDIDTYKLTTMQNLLAVVDRAVSQIRPLSAEEVSQSHAEPSLAI